MSPRLSKATIVALLVAVALVSVGGQQSYIPPAGGALTIPVSVPVPGIAVTSTDGVTLENATPATAGVPVQQSPRLRFRSNVWNTTAVAATNTNDLWFESVPVSDTSPTGVLRLGSSLNGAAATTPMAFASHGGTIGAVSPPSDASILLPNNRYVYFQNAAGNAFTGGFGFDSSGNARVGGASASALTSFNSNTDLGTAGLPWRTIVVTNINRGGVVLISGTAPSAPVACTSPSVLSSNGSVTALIDVGTTCAGISTLVVTMPAVTTGWDCATANKTTPATSDPGQSGDTTTTITITNYSRTTGIAAAWTDGDDIRVGPCFPR